MKRYRESIQSEVYDFLKEMELFSTWEHDKLKELAINAVIESYGPNFIILKENDTVNNLCIIKRGLIKLHKSIDKPHQPSLTCK